MSKQAPEIFQRSLTSLDLTGLPPTTDSGFEEAVIFQYAMQYAAKGWTAAVVVSDGMVRVVAVPQQGICSLLVFSIQSKVEVDGILP